MTARVAKDYIRPLKNQKELPNFVDCNTKVVRASPSDLGGVLSISVSASSLLQKL